jgi:hypothetical protein
MLSFDPEKRISAAKAIVHPWILKNTETIIIEEVLNGEALKNLKNFRAETKL